MTILVFFFVFLFEILVLCIIRRGYIFSFFFWMDLISTFSTVFEIPFVIEILQLDFLAASTNVAKLLHSYFIFIRAGRATRVSSRATRLIRVIRLIRFVRITKLYKYAQKSLDLRCKMLLNEIQLMRE